MMEIKESVERLSAEIMREKGSCSLRQSIRQESPIILNATSECPYGECDGGGISVLLHRDGHRTAKVCRCKTDIAIKRKLEAVGAPNEFKGIGIKDFTVDIYNGENKRLAATAKMIAVGYINNFEKVKEKGKGLFFYGKEKGSGKTRLAASVGNALVIKCLQNVKFLTTINLLNRIRAAFDGREKEDELIKEMIDEDVLILDDIGSEKPSEWVNNIFYTIMNERMNEKKITIFTSNTSVEKLNLDERIKSRIDKMTIPVKMPEESIRHKQSRIENEQILKEILS